MKNVKESIHAHIENPSQINNRGKVILKMMELYPEAALKNFDSDDMLPIHRICLNNGNFEALKALVEGCPDLLITEGKLLSISLFCLS